jgi:hypothetical protein
MEWVESHSGEETIAEITFKKILESFNKSKSYVQNFHNVVLNGKLSLSFLMGNIVIC